LAAEPAGGPPVGPGGCRVVLLGRAYRLAGMASRAAFEPRSLGSDLGSQGRPPRNPSIHTGSAADDLLLTTQVTPKSSTPGGSAPGCRRLTAHPHEQTGAARGLGTERPAIQSEVVTLTLSRVRQRLGLSW